MSWGYLFVGFGCGDVDIGKGEVLSRLACSGASGGGAVCTEWRDEGRCSVGRPFNSPFGDRVNSGPAGALGFGSESLRGSGRENGTRQGPETQLACEYRRSSILAVVNPIYVISGLMPLAQELLRQWQPRKRM